MEARVTESDDAITISGHGAVFNRFYTVFGFKERVAPGAFDKTLLENPDIRGMFNHDPNFLLGRTKSGTMDVRTDRKGLAYEIRADRQDPQAQSVSRKISRGDVDGSSMAFFVHKEEWKEENGQPTERTLLEVELIETGPVTMPASPATTAKIQRAFQETGIDYEAIHGLMVKYRAGFGLQDSDQRLIERTIEFLETLKSKPGALHHLDQSTSGKAPDPRDYSEAARRLRNRLTAALA